MDPIKMADGWHLERVLRIYTILYYYSILYVLQKIQWIIVRLPLKCPLTRSYENPTQGKSEKQD